VIKTYRLQIFLQIAALIIENTFTSLPNVVRDWPIIGHFSFLCNQKWNSTTRIPLLPTSLPILMLSGERDEVVPQKHMEELRDRAQRRGEKQVKKSKHAVQDADDTPELTNVIFRSFPDGYHGRSACKSVYLLYA
jgi:pimeloyl-ACP methyl ester carboxylesterase